ncbi:MAG: glycosyltransferase family 39 protein [Methanophagales archaeon]|nr:glycosyltransferase family 39 protein [Methanophagales archaeon]
MTKNNILQTRKSGILREWIKNHFTFARILILLILSGIILRILTYWTDIPRFDGTYYATLGYNFLRYHDFLDLECVTTYARSWTYPVYFAVFYYLFGFTIPVTKIASIFMSIAVLGVVYLTTRDLFDHQKALVATAIIAVTSTLIVITGKSWIENIVLLFFIPAVWALIKGFKDSRYIVVASVFAGLTYYTKTDVGFMVIIGGILAFAAWRFYYMRWSLFKDKNYYIAFIVILLMALLRAELIWSASESILYTTQVASPSRIFTMGGFLRFLSQIPYHVLLLWSFFIFWVPELKDSVKKIGAEYYSFLFLIIMGLTFLVIFHASGYPMFSTSPLLRVSREYITIIFVPALWLVLKNANLTGQKTSETFKSSFSELIVDKKRMCLILCSLFIAAGTAFIDDWLAIILIFGAFSFAIQSTRKRIMLMLMVLSILSANSITGAYQPGYIEASEEISRSVCDGDVIALVSIKGGGSLITNWVYPYITNHNVSVVYYEKVDTPTFIMSQSNTTFAGYTFIDVYYGNVRPTILKRFVSRFFETDIVGVEKKGTGEAPIYLWRRASR